MVLWRKRKSQTPHSPATVHRRINRRMVLKWLAASAAGAALAPMRGSTRHNPEPQYISGVDIAEYKHKPPILTNQKRIELFKKKGIPFDERSSKDLQTLIEAWPDIAKTEMSWYKQYGRPGQVVPVSTKRYPTASSTDPIDKKTRSKIHTHVTLSPLHKFPKELVDRVLSKLSGGDVVGLYTLGIEGLTEYGNPLRTSHVVAINSSGKRMGYYSLRINRRAASENVREFVFNVTANFGDFVAAASSGNVAEANKLFSQYEEILEEGKKAKIIIVHTTPSLGYVYKDGHFQKKPNNK